MEKGRGIFDSVHKWLETSSGSSLNNKIINFVGSTGMGQLAWKWTKKYFLWLLIF